MISVAKTANGFCFYAFDVTSQKLLDAVVEVVAIAINHVKINQALKEQEERLTKQTEILLQQTQELEKITSKFNYKIYNY